MAGLALNMGAFGSAGGGYAPAATPSAAGASPQATTIGQKAFGIVTGGADQGTVGPVALISVGTLSLLGLFFIWYSLPR